MKRLAVFALLACVVLALGSVTMWGAERPLRVTFSWPTYIDPAVGSDYSSSSSLVNLYDGLVYPDIDGSPLPHVATDWEVSEDGRTWTFFLRDDVYFHNGDQLTASDVKFSMDRLTTIGEGYGYLFVGRVESTEVVDDFTVRFNLVEPFGPFITALYRLYILNEEQVMENVREGPYGELGDYGRGWLRTNAAGSGPYMLREFRLEEELVMVPNPNYWLPIDPQAPDLVRFIGTTEAVTVRTMMARRELEISDQWQTLEAWRTLEAIDGVDVLGFVSAQGFYYMVHNKLAPTDCVHFRRAMAWAVDYETITEMLFPGSKRMRSPVPSDLWGFEPVHAYERDLDKAREELAQSVYYGDLARQEVVVHWTAEVPDLEKIALLFMSNMADVGINVRVVRMPWMSLIENMADIETSPNITTIFVSAHYPEAGSILESRFHSASAPTWEQNEWLLDPVLDELIEDALAAVDPDLREEKYAEAQRYIADLAASLDLFEPLEKHAYQAAYVDWPAAHGEVIPVMGYNVAARFILIDAESREALDR